MELEQLEEVKTFLNNHKDEIDGLAWAICHKAIKNLTYYYIDGRPSAHYDKEFYVDTINTVLWSFCENTYRNDPTHSDGYKYPDDWPEFCRRRLL